MKKDHAFTLTELLVVIAVIAVLGYDSASCAQHPADYRPGKDPGARNGKKGEELLKRLCPSRSNNVHINLPALVSSPIHTSVGGYVLVDKPSRSFA